MSPIRKIFFATAACLALLLCASVSQAQSVQYSTTGIFGASGTNILTFGIGEGNPSSITFLGAALATVDAPTFASFGTFVTQSTLPAPKVPITPTTFTLNIFQTIPSLGTDSLVGSLSGTLSTNSSTGQVIFTAAQTEAQIGAVTYTIDAQTKLVAPNTGGLDLDPLTGSTTLEGQIVVPEPSTMLLLGLSLAGVGGVAVRRMRKADEEVEA